jgi:hypothetical protein
VPYRFKEKRSRKLTPLGDVTWRDYDGRTKQSGPGFLYKMEWSDVKRIVLDRIETGAWADELTREDVANGSIYSSIEFDSFTGGSEAQVKEWLTKGYDRKVKASGVTTGDVYAKPRRRMRWTDDGDLDVGQALAGADFPFYAWDKRPTKPGLSMMIEVCFHAGVKPRILTEYGEWITAQIKRLEMIGYDLDVNVVMPLRNLFETGQGHRYQERIDLTVSLKRENETADFKSWSAMFSPAGFRCMGFTAMHLAAHDTGRKCQYGLGQPAPSGRWDVLLNQNTRQMRVTCPPGPSSFPAEEMTDAFLAALPEAK